MAFDLDDEELEATRRLNGVAKENNVEENNINKKVIIELINFAIGVIGHRDAYTTGMCNGMKYIKSVITDTEPNYYECPKQDSIPTQKIIDKIKVLKDRADRIAGTYQFADSAEDLQEKKNWVIELRTKAEALEELLKDK